MTAWLGEAQPLSVPFFEGEHPLVRQGWAPEELLSGSVNADGWGVAWWHDGRAVRLARAEPPWYDPDLRGVLDAVRARCAVAALRNATDGLPVGPADVPPFIRGRWAFVLNGFVPDFRHRHARALRATLSDALYVELRGASDAETVFMMAVAALESGASPAEALDHVIAAVLERVTAAGGDECQLALLLADGESVVAARASNVDRTNSLYVLDHGGMAPSGVLVASERLDGDAGWRPVPPHHRLTVDGDGVRTEPLPVG